MMIPYQLAKFQASISNTFQDNLPKRIFFNGGYIGLEINTGQLFPREESICIKFQD